MNQEQKRVEWLDIAKGILIMLVVLGHIITINNTWIQSFHIPAFFIVNGILKKKTSFIEKNDSLKKILKKQKKTFIYYVIFSIISIGRLLVQFKLGMYSYQDMKIFLLHSLFLNGIGVLWYIPAFLLGECLFYFVFKYKKYILYIITTIVICILIWQKIIPIGNVLNEENILYIIISFLIRGFIASTFMMIGYWLEKFNKKNFLLLISIISFFYYMNGKVDLNKLIFNNIILYYIFAIAGTLLIILISKLIETIKIKEIFIFWGKNSLFIMLTHTTFIIYKISSYIAGYIIPFSIEFQIAVSLMIAMAIETMMILLKEKLIGRNFNI